MEMETETETETETEMPRDVSLLSSTVLKLTSVSSPHSSTVVICVTWLIHMGVTTHSLNSTETFPRSDKSAIALEYVAVIEGVRCSDLRGVVQWLKEYVDLVEGVCSSPIRTLPCTASPLGFVIQDTWSEPDSAFFFSLTWISKNTFKHQIHHKTLWSM